MAVSGVWVMHIQKRELSSEYHVEGRAIALSEMSLMATNAVLLQQEVKFTCGEDWFRITNYTTNTIIVARPKRKQHE